MQRPQTNYCASAPSNEREAPPKRGRTILLNVGSALVGAASTWLPLLTGRAKSGIVGALSCGGRRSRRPALLADARRRTGFPRCAHLETDDGSIMLSNRAATAEREECNREYQAG